MARHPISMAAGIMPEATPHQLIEAAVAGGFDFGGMWVERDTWNAATRGRSRHSWAMWG